MPPVVPLSWSRILLPVVTPEPVRTVPATSRLVGADVTVRTSSAIEPVNVEVTGAMVAPVTALTASLGGLVFRPVAMSPAACGVARGASQVNRPGARVAVNSDVQRAGDRLNLSNRELINRAAL